MIKNIIHKKIDPEKATEPPDSSKGGNHRHESKIKKSPLDVGGKFSYNTIYTDTNNS